MFETKRALREQIAELRAAEAAAKDALEKAEGCKIQLLRKNNYLTERADDFDKTIQQNRETIEKTQKQLNAALKRADAAEDMVRHLTAVVQEGNTKLNSAIQEANEETGRLFGRIKELGEEAREARQKSRASANDVIRIQDQLKWARMDVDKRDQQIQKLTEEKEKLEEQLKNALDVREQLNNMLSYDGGSHAEKL